MREQYLLLRSFKGVGIQALAYQRPLLEDAADTQRQRIIGADQTFARTPYCASGATLAPALHPAQGAAAR